MARARHLKGLVRSRSFFGTDNLIHMISSSPIVFVVNCRFLISHMNQDVVHVLEVREADLASPPRIDVVGGEATGVDDLEDTVLHGHLPLGLLPASEDD